MAEDLTSHTLIESTVHFLEDIVALSGINIIRI